MWFKLLLAFLLISTSESLFRKQENIEELTASNFDSKVTEKSSFWVTVFYVPNCEKCKQFSKQFIELAKNFKGVAKFGAINVKAEKKLAKALGVDSNKECPAMKVFTPDSAKPISIQLDDLKNPIKIADQIKNVIVKTIENRFQNVKPEKRKRVITKKAEDDFPGEVVVLTDSNFEKLVFNSKHPWMVEFFAPWCGHCQRLAPEWKEAAKKMGGKVKFGALDATVHNQMAQKFGIQGFPTIKYFGPGSTDRDAIDFHGERTAQGLINFATEKATEIVPPPEIIEGISEDAVQEACSDKQLCVFAFLPPLLDCQSSCRNQHIAMINDVIEHFKRRQWGWVWMEGGTQNDVELAFGVGGFGYPAMSVLSPKKMKFVTFRGSFSKESIVEFLEGIGYGKSRVESISPKALNDDGFLKVGTIAAWNGKDAEEPKMEEIDLSDVDMKTEL
ncbi:unnamed protein product [Caenorhabditis bovis]|uniref:Thioredoxin domain-containing protein n=1 Tax=Caenorhabditis bovis TaxID=2654633 RepID=A0A8S1EZF1_9PELO|nr:unnamed protein product [Caenorhabditis bovis]